MNVLAAATSGGQDAGGVLCLAVVIGLVVAAVLKARGGS